MKEHPAGGVGKRARTRWRGEDEDASVETLVGSKEGARGVLPTPPSAQLYPPTAQLAHPTPFPEHHMQQGFKSENITDPEGRPAGGYVDGVGLRIDWQNGPLGRGEERIPPNGAFVEDVIAATIQRIEHYQTVQERRFACRENAIALTHLETALLWLDKRTRAREARGVEGTHQA